LHRELVVFQHKHTTPSKARVYYLEKFTGDYVHLFDYDNIMPPIEYQGCGVYKEIGAEFLFSNVKVVNISAHDVGGPLVNIEDHAIF